MFINVLYFFNKNAFNVFLLLSTFLFLKTMNGQYEKRIFNVFKYFFLNVYYIYDCLYLIWAHHQNSTENVSRFYSFAIYTMQCRAYMF